MSVSASVSASADDDQQGLTLREIEQFVQRARAAGLADDVVPSFATRDVQRYDYSLGEEPRQVAVLNSLHASQEG